MSTLSQFTGAKLPVGSIVQAPYNLTDPDYLPCDGREVLRANYPLLSACLPDIGKFTTTSRTKPATPISAAIATNGTVWVVTGAAGTNNLHTTTDGITFTARTTPASTDVRAIMHDGVNFVAITSNGNPLYSTDGGANWIASASGTAVAGASMQTVLTWAPTLGTVGRFCFAAASAVYTSDDRGVTWATRTHGVGGSLYNVCWTGQRFIATDSLNNNISTSTDGITWDKQALPFASGAAAAATSSIISDGNGKVLWIGPISGNAGIATSQDHGATWGVRLFGFAGSSIVNPSGTASYTNGRFFMTSNTNNVISSTDLIGWVFTNLGANSLSQGTFSYKSGVYFINKDASSTAAFTATEDTAYMTLPQSAQNTSSSSDWNNFMPFIKVS